MWKTAMPFGFYIIIKIWLEIVILYWGGGGADINIGIQTNKRKTHTHMKEGCYLKNYINLFSHI